MKVELSIKDDKELRNLVKDMIRGQVKSCVRDEIMELIDDTVETEVRKKLPSVAYERLLNHVSASDMQEAMDTAIHERVNTKTEGQWEAAIMKEARKIVSEKVETQLLEYVSTKVVDVPLSITIGEQVKNS